MKQFLYDFKTIESKWQNFWIKNKIFQASNDLSKKKFYCLDMFPYPSSNGLHVGHIEGYTASDIVSRFKKMQGYNVLHPVGWDAFGLSAEQYAIETGNNPQNFTYQNIKNFKEQMILMGKGVDWDRELATSDPSFYHWTQWIFQQLYKKDLALLKDVDANFCEDLGTVLANEEVVCENGNLYSVRGHFPVVKKKLKQWVLKINHYAERLLKDLDLVEYPDYLKQIQRNWIGKSEGVIINFKIDNSAQDNLEIFTTRPDTIYGVTFCVLAPEHPLINKITQSSFKDQITNYVEKSKQQLDVQRLTNKDKTGVFTGTYAINPVNKKKVPIWVSDFVLSSFGTGAVAGVPAHDKKDFNFAKKYQLEIIYVIKPEDSDCIQSIKSKNLGFFDGDGIHFDSDFLNGLNNKQAKKKITNFLEQNKLGHVHIYYKMSDYCFSRHRYWGEPFPVFFDEDNQIILFPENELPIELPHLSNFLPSRNTDETPLMRAKEWFNFYIDGKKYTKDSKTMSQLAGSSWYYIAYILKNKLDITALNTQKAKQLLDHFLPVDLYIGGAEHATGHLICVRFFHKFLFDLNLVSCVEPFKKLLIPGVILGHDNTKMSKSKGNGVSAALMLKKYGADVLRVYEMFLGPLSDVKVWSEKTIKGSISFLERVYRMFSFEIIKDNQSHLQALYHQTIKKVTANYEKFKFNIVISQLMIFVNAVYKYRKISQIQMEGFLKLLYPIVPHLTEELNQLFLKKTPLCYSDFPSYNPNLLSLNNIIDIVIQINGKLRTTVAVNIDESQDNILSKVLNDAKIRRYIVDRKQINKIFFIKNKLLNIVLN